MYTYRFAAGLALGALSLGIPAVAQNENRGQGQAIVTIMPADKHSESRTNISAQDLTLKVNGKESNVTRFSPARGANSPLELVILMDSGARTSISTQLHEIDQFAMTLPASTKLAVAYMQNGVAKLSGPLTTDRAQALKGLHIPSGIPGESASPYFCLSNLATHWPSQDQNARREVVMITDGVDYYHPGFDLDDPYVQTAIKDSTRAGLVVYSIYWRNRGRYDETMVANATGQDLLQQITHATGGKSYWIGTGDPVSFNPYFEDLQKRFENQYELSFTAPLKNKAEVEDLKLKVNGISGKVDAPASVYVSPGM